MNDYCRPSGTTLGIGATEDDRQRWNLNVLQMAAYSTAHHPGESSALEVDNQTSESVILLA